MAATDPSDDEARALFRLLQDAFPSGSLGTERWYLLALTSLVAAGQSHHAATLYLHLLTEPHFSTPTQRMALMRRMREALVKSVAIVGVCRPLDAIFDIAAVEREEDRDLGFSRRVEHWQSGPENLARGQAWLDTIYKENGAGTVKPLEAHKDFAWISRNITYGLYLSDHSILDAIETEIVVLAGIMCQNLPRETAWHLRGLRRVGVGIEDVETIQHCIEMVAKFAGVRVDKVPRVTDIEHEV